MNLGIETAAQKASGNAALFTLTAGKQDGKTSFAEILNIVQSENQKPAEHFQTKAKAAVKTVAEPKAKAAKTEVKKAAPVNQAASTERSAESATNGEQAEAAKLEETDQANNVADTRAQTKTGETKTQDKTAETPALIQTISMEELIKTLNLNDEQKAALADALGVKAEELSQVKLEIAAQQDKNGQTELKLSAVMPDGKVKDLSKLLGDEKAAKAQQFAQKLADIMGLDEKQAQDLFSALNVSAIEVKQADNRPAETLQQAAPKTAPLTVAQASAGAVKEIAHTETQTGNGGLNAKAETEKGTAETAPVANESGKADFAAVLDRTANAHPLHATHAAPKAEAAHAVEAVAHAEKAHGARIMNQIVEKASILSLPHATQTKITLNPEALGTVDIQLHMADSSVRAAIVVESAAVKQAVEQNLDQLKAALQEQGITVQEMNVSVNQNNGGGNFAAQMEQRESAARGHETRHSAKDPEAAPVRAPRWRRADAIVDITA